MTHPSVTAESGEWAAEPSAQDRRKVVTSSFIGNFVEWFDYGAYSYLAVTIGLAFFHGDVENSTFMAFVLFAMSFLVRPFGAFFWGYWGDRFGRSKTLAWSILLMSGATFCIGVLPGSQTIGILAPLLLLFFRMVQGFSAAGEYAGASALLTEYAPRGKRGMYAAVVPGSTATGLLLGSVFATVLYGTLTPEAMEAWGWRVPFLLAAPLGLIGLYIRRQIADTPAFKKDQARQQAAVEDLGAKQMFPVKDLLVNHPKQLAQGFGIVLLNAVGFYVVLTFMPTYMSEQLGYDTAASQFATTLTLATYISFIFLTGFVADRIGRRSTLILASCTFVVLSIPAFMVMNTGHYWLAVLALVAMGGVLSLNDGALPSAICELYPTAVRFTGFALVFNVGNALFGGPMSAVNTWLIDATGNTMWPAYILMTAAVIALGAVLWSKDNSKRDISY